jgi:hypothetical protein
MLQILLSVTIGISSWYGIDFRKTAARAGKVAAEARRRNVFRSTIVRESLERALGGPSSRADLAGNLVGAFRSGRRDLSTNKKLLADRFERTSWPQAS